MTLSVRTPILIVVAVIALAVAVGLADDESRQSPSAKEILSAHLSHGIGASPFDADIWQDEANAQLIVASRKQATLTELERFAASRADLNTRLLLLQEKGFLRVEAGTVRATFPILIGAERDQYMEIVSKSARRVFAELRPGWRALLHELRVRGWREWAYHFVWSQTMDSGFAWTSMIAKQRVPALSTVMVWVIYPAHPFKSGTNYYPDTEVRDQLLAVTWRPAAPQTLARIQADWKSIWSAAIGVAAASERTRLRDLGITDESGRSRVPIVSKADPLYAGLDGLASEHVRLVARHLPLRALRRLTAAPDQTTFAMAYHDVGWEILKMMVVNGMIDVPPGLIAGAREDVSVVGVCSVVDTPAALMSELKRALGLK